MAPLASLLSLIMSSIMQPTTAEEAIANSAAWRIFSEMSPLFELHSIVSD